MITTVIIIIGVLLCLLCLYFLFATVKAFKSRCIHDNIMIEQYQKDIIVDDTTTVRVEFKVYKCSKCDNITTSSETLISYNFSDENN